MFPEKDIFSGLHPGCSRNFSGQNTTAVDAVAGPEVWVSAPTSRSGAVQQPWHWWASEGME